MKLLRWALWSRTRLLSAVAGILGGMLFVSLCAALVAPHHTAPTPVAATASAAPTSSTVTGGRPADGSPAQQVLAVATEFLDVWMHPEDPVSWSEKLRPYATPDLVAMSFAVDTSAIPRGHPRQVVVQDLTPTNALVRAHLTRGVTVFVNLEPTDDGWRVNGLTGKHQG